jgi:hypothetical protein
LNEIDRSRIAAADDNSDAFSCQRLVCARCERRERRRSPRLGHNTQGAPQRYLGLSDGLISHKHRIVYIGFGDGKYALADAGGG